MHEISVGALVGIASICFVVAIAFFLILRKKKMMEERFTLKPLREDLRQAMDDYRAAFDGECYAPFTCGSSNPDDIIDEIRRCIAEDKPKEYLSCQMTLLFRN